VVKISIYDKDGNLMSGVIGSQVCRPGEDTPPYPLDSELEIRVYVDANRLANEGFKEDGDYPLWGLMMLSKHLPEKIKIRLRVYPMSIMTNPKHMWEHGEISLQAYQKAIRGLK